jgi:hypothetical protein
MKKPPLNEEQYIAKLNEVLQQHPDYGPGMAFMPYPEWARGADIKGIAITGFGWNRAYMETSNRVQSEFEIAATQGGFQTQVR